MKIRAIQWAAVDTYLKLVRAPLDAAVGILPDGGTGVRPGAKAALDGADAGMRAIVAMVFGDPVSLGDASTQRRYGDREQRHDGRGHQSNEPRARHPKEQQERAREPRGRMRHKAAPTSPQPEAARRPTAVAEPSAAAPAPTAASRNRGRAAAITGTAARTPARTAGSGSLPGAGDVVTAEHQASPASADKMLSEPTHEEIAARAYELYERGVPGDAPSHWEAAKRELTSASR